MAKRSFVKQILNKTTIKRRMYNKWLKNHSKNEFYLSPNKSTVVDGSFMRYLLFHRRGFDYKGCICSYFVGVVLKANTMPL